MKIKIQRADERGSAKNSTVDTHYSFSFSNYYNPEKMGFGALRVLNDDIFAPGKGFGFHSHDNMEIVTIVLEGELEHRDSEENHGITGSGEVQSMSAGSGITHSEVNHSKTKPLKLLQIWVHTKEPNIKPAYMQKKFSGQQKKNKLLVVASGDKKEGGVYIHQDAKFLLGSLDKGLEVTHRVSSTNQGMYLFVLSGEIQIEKEKLSARDAAEITEAQSISIKPLKQSEVLLIEVPLIGDFS